MNIGNLEETLLRRFLEEADIFIFQEDFNEKKYQELISFFEKLVGIDIDERAYWIDSPESWPDDDREKYEKIYSLVFYHPSNKYPGEFGEAIEEIRRRNPEYLKRNVGNVVLEWMPILIERAYQIDKKEYLIILFNKRPFSIDRNIPERVLRRGYNLGAWTEYKGRIFIVVQYQDPEKFLRLLLHEIGHYYGLDDHEDNRKCVMTPDVEINEHFTFCEECAEKLRNVLLV